LIEAIKKRTADWKPVEMERAVAFDIRTTGTAGVVGALLAPVLAAIGAIVALLKDCTIQVERDNSQGTGGTKV
jgi:hypothetical protein